MSLSLVDLIGMICEECKGFCCADFQVYRKDFFTGEIKRNRVYSKNHPRSPHAKVKWKTFQIQRGDITSKTFYIAPCAYWHLGGCPNNKKPKACRDWVCGMLDDILYLPSQFSRQKGTGPLLATIEGIEKVLITDII